jgi:predicted nuclease of predicted toxin-antitoxin system
MVRLLFDQMIDADAVGEVRLMGFDVVHVADFGMSRANDDQVLGLAIQGNRILVTLDEHFGDWTFLKLERHPGVIRVKAHPTSTKSVLSVLVPFLRSHGERDFCNHLVVIGKARVRWIQTS